MRKFFTLIAAALMSVCASAESSQAGVKLTYVDYNQADVSFGEIAAGSTAQVGFNKISDGTVGWGYVGWNVNYVGYIQVDASAVEGTIQNVSLTFDVSGATDSKRTTKWGVGYNSSTWSADMTYNTADLSITTLGDLQETSTKASGTFETKTFDITDAFTEDEDKIVTIVVYETAAAGGYLKNPSATVTYTTGSVSNYFIVRELDAENQIDTITYKGILVGETVKPSSADIADFYVDGVKYVYVSGADNSITVDEDKDKNYIHVTFKEADIINYTIVSSLGEELDFGNSYVGDAVKYAYPRYQELNGTLYQSSVNNKEYTNTFTPTADNPEAVVNYSNTNKENIVYLNEGEHINGFTETTTGNLPIRGSNGKGGVTTEDVTIVSLPAGKYVMVVGAFTSKQSQQDLNFTVGGTAYTASSSSNLNENTSPEFTLTGEENDVVFLGSTSSADAQLDYIYIQKTGDYNYFDMKTSLPDTITVTLGEVEDYAKLNLSDYISVKTNADEYFPVINYAVAEEGVDKKDATYTPVESEKPLYEVFTEPGTYYVFADVVSVFADETVNHVSTDTVVVTITEKVEPVVSTHTWSLTNWSEATISNLKADAAASKTEGWSDVEKKATADADGEPTELSKDNCFWFAGTANADGELEANGQVIEELKGLTFPTTAYNSARSIAIAVNYQDLQVYDDLGQVTGNADFGPYNGASYFWLGGSDKDCFIIKNVKAGTTITMGVESHKLTNARGVKLSVDGTELTDPDGNAVAAPTVYAEQTWQVPGGALVAGAKGGALSADAGDEVVDVLVHNTNGCHIYFIDAEISEPTPTAISSVEEEAEAVKAGKFFENGQIVIIKAGKKFNAAGAQIK